MASSVMWNQTYCGVWGEVAYSMVEASDGGYAIAGYTQSFGAGDSDFWLVKTDSNGNVVWNQTYSGKYSERAYSLVETSDGGFVLVGSNAAIGNDGDFWLIRTDQQGIPEFPLWAILPLLIASTLLAIFFKKRLHLSVSRV